MSDFIKITGKIESFGTYIIEANKGRFESIQYSVIRLLDSNGDVKVLKNVRVTGVPHSYMKVGVEGTFYMMTINSASMIFAAKVDDRNICDEDEMNGIIVSLKEIGTYTSLLLFLGIITIPLIVGIIFIIVSIRLKIKGRKIIKKYSKENISSYLKSEGFAV